MGNGFGLPDCAGGAKDVELSYDKSNFLFATCTPPQPTTANAYAAPAFIQTQAKGTNGFGLPDCAGGAKDVELSYDKSNFLFATCTPPQPTTANAYAFIQTKAKGTNGFGLPD